MAIERKGTRAAHGAEEKGIVILVLISILVGTCALVLFLDDLAWKGVSQAPMRPFQRMVGGIGMGAIATPIWNFINFDPRIESVDDSLTWPIAGGYPYGPDRTSTVTYFQEIPENQFLRRDRGD